jgi:hypothetical protein
MIVADFMNKRIDMPATFGKRIRILESDTREYLGGPYNNADRHIFQVKVTSKYVFIFVD